MWQLRVFVRLLIKCQKLTYLLLINFVLRNVLVLSKNISKFGRLETFSNKLNFEYYCIQMKFKLNNILIIYAWCPLVNITHHATKKRRRLFLAKFTYYVFRISLKFEKV